MGLELARGFVAEGRVFAVGVVVTFDVIEDFGLGVVGVLEASVLKHFEFESPDEGFSPGVVVGVGPCGHALAHAGFGQDMAEGGAPVLAATVAVEDDASGGAYWAGLEGLEKRVEHQVAAHVGGETPADDAA